MAAPFKKGLDYFPLDVGFFEDEKILAISGEFAIKGEVIALRLLCEIYRNGYFVEYSELLKNKLARLSGLSAGLVDEVTNKLVRYNFFDEGIFREHQVLTSIAIQKRYFEATKRRKNHNCTHYLLIGGVNVNINSQSKVKESKVKKRRREEKISSQSPLDPEIEKRIASNSLKPLNEIFQTLDENQQWKEAICMNHNIQGNTVEIKLNNLQKLLNEFYNHLSGDMQVKEKSLQDTYSHFANWLRKKKEYERK